MTFGNILYSYLFYLFIKKDFELEGEEGIDAQIDSREREREKECEKGREQSKFMNNKYK